MLIRAASERDLPAIEGLLRDANDTPYDLARVAYEKCFEAGPAGLPVTLLAENDGLLDGLVSFIPGSVRILAIRRGARRRQIGTALLGRVTPAPDGSISVFGEAGNYFLPGVPETDEGSLAFYRSRGFQPGSTHAVNLVVDLAGNPLIPEEPLEGVDRASPADRDEILGLILRRFGHVWAWEASRAMLAHPSTLFLLRDDQGRAYGFSAFEANNRGLGFFGPMGVDPDARGKGAGRALLLAALTDLRRLGHSEAIISWADNAEFYERVAGARRHLRMIRFSKRQNPL